MASSRHADAGAGHRPAGVVGIRFLTGFCFAGLFTVMEAG
jgi:hypothetical protein